MSRTKRKGRACSPFGTARAALGRCNRESEDLLFSAGGVAGELQMRQVCLRHDAIQERPQTHRSVGKLFIVTSQPLRLRFDVFVSRIEFEADRQSTTEGFFELGAVALQKLCRLLHCTHQCTHAQESDFAIREHHVSVLLLRSDCQAYCV